MVQGAGAPPPSWGGKAGAVIACQALLPSFVAADKGRRCPLAGYVTVCHMRRTLWISRSLSAVTHQITSTASVCPAHPIQLGPISPAPTPPPPQPPLFLLSFYLSSFCPPFRSLFWLPMLSPLPPPLIFPLLLHRSSASSLHQLGRCASLPPGMVLDSIVCPLPLLSLSSNTLLVRHSPPSPYPWPLHTWSSQMRGLDKRAEKEGGGSFCIPMEQKVNDGSFVVLALEEKRVFLPLCQWAATKEQKSMMRTFYDLSYKFVCVLGPQSTVSELQAYYVLKICYSVASRNDSATEIAN